MGIPQIDQEIIDSLDKLDGSWKKSEPRTSGSLPDADYLCRIDAMIVNRSKNGRLQVVTDYTVYDGKYKGSKGKKFDGVETEQNMDWFKGYCEVLGVDVPVAMKELPYALNDFVESNKSLVWFTIKSKDGYTNTNIKALADEIDGGEELGAEFPPIEPEPVAGEEAGEPQLSEEFITVPDDDANQILEPEPVPVPAPAPARRAPVAAKPASKPPVTPAARSGGRLATRPAAKPAPAKRPAARR